MENFFWFNQGKPDSTADVKLVHVQLSLSCRDNCPLPRALRCQGTWFHEVCNISQFGLLFRIRYECELITHCFNLEPLINCLTYAVLNSFMISVFHTFSNYCIFLLSHHSCGLKMECFLILCALFRQDDLDGFLN